MESSIRNVLTFFFASLLLLLSSPSPANSSIQLVETVCKKTINNAECLRVLVSDPRSKSASNYKQLAQAAVDLAIANAKDSQAFIKNLLKSDPRDPIKQCAGFYDAVVASFSSAKQEIEEDPQTANYDINVAGEDAGNCDTALKGVQVPEISNRNNAVKLYSSIGQVITDELY